MNIAMISKHWKIILALVMAADMKNRQRTFQTILFLLLKTTTSIY